jgi:hypothetical protein
MSWYPFIKQTVDMVRDNEHIYERGPGYSHGENGVGTGGKREVERARRARD